MPSIQPEDIGDLVKDTLRDLGRLKYTDLSTDLQRHVAMRMFTKHGNYKIGGDSYGFQWNLLMNPSANTRNVGWFETVNLNIMDGMVQAQVPWRNMTGGYAIEQREIVANSGAAKIVDLLQERRIQHLVDWSEKFERNFWTAPVATDTTAPYGLPYWVTKSATAGFTGDTLSGFSSTGNLSPTTYSRWKSYAAPYTDVTKNDMILALRTAADKTDFMPPVDGIPTFNTGDNYGYYTTLSVKQSFETLAESQNENLGVDMDPMSGRPTFRKTPINWVPILDQDTTGPFYGVNWGEFKMAVMKGWWLNEKVENQTPLQPTVTSVYVNSTYNFLCRNRRRQFVLSTGTTVF